MSVLKVRYALVTGACLGRAKGAEGAAATAGRGLPTPISGPPLAMPALRIRYLHAVCTEIRGFENGSEFRSRITRAPG